MRKMFPIAMIAAFFNQNRRGRRALCLAIIIVGIVLMAWIVSQNQFEPAITNNRVSRSGGIINWIISNMPFECHIPTYRYCGPGTKRERGGQPKNLLDAACRTHDIEYESMNLADRHRADQVLLHEAWRRCRSSDATWEESIVALIVIIAMKLKLYFGF